MKAKYIIKISILLGLTLSSFLKLQAQVIYFDGVGRALVSNNALNGDVTTGDTVSNQRTIGGYTVFDLGVNVMPSKKFNARAVLRARNEFGQFFGNGSLLEFREIQLSGLLADAIYYQIGDIDVEQTPFTTYNHDEIYHSFESSIFGKRREILEYENFNHGNKWRLQGAQTNLSFSMDKGFDYLNLSAFGTRTVPANNIDVPDRFLAGGQVGLVKDSLLNLGLNYTGFLDNPSIEDNFQYTNHVLTLNGKVNLLKNNFDLALVGETGLSSYDFEDEANDTTVSFNDFFYEAGVHFKKNKLSAQLVYREVGPQFSSPSAQTQRINPNSVPLLFGRVAEDTRMRSQLLFDRFGQEVLYNGGISPVLFNTLVAFNNALPYGVATPNRAGVHLTSELKSDSNDVFRAELNAALLNEVIGEGTQETRGFVLLSGGVSANLANQFEWDKDLVISFGAKYETASRDGRAAVDVSSLLIDAGIEAEVFHKFYLEAGYKMLQASGTEFVASRDKFNGISSFGLLNLDQSEQIVALGAAYRFGPRSMLSADYFLVDFDNKLESNFNYSIGQLFINYTMSF